MLENDQPTLSNVTCPTCGLVFQEQFPSDHPLTGHCPRCGDDASVTREATF